MQKAIQSFIRLLFLFFLSLRYRVEVKGLEKIKGDGLLILPNHVSILDATIFQVFTWKRFHARPFATKRFTEISFLRPLFALLNAIAVPDCTVGKNSVKIYQLEKAFEDLLKGLKKGENILFYPAGHLKISGLEKLGGASGLHTLLAKERSLRLVLVRTTGLWGSRFSPAPHGRTPDLKEEAKRAIRTFLRRPFYFPKRKVTIELEAFTLPSPLPSRLELNHMLEDWYNAPFGKEGEVPLPPMSLKPFFPPLEVKETSPLEREIIEMVAKIGGYPVKEVSRETHLFYDLGFDSLEAAELLHLLEEKYHLTHLYTQELITPAHIALQVKGKWRSERARHHQAKEGSKLTLLRGQKSLPKKAGHFSPKEVYIALKKSSLRFAAFDEQLGLTTPKGLVKRVDKGINRVLLDDRHEIPLFFPPSLERGLAALSVYLAGKKPCFLDPKEAALEKGTIFSSHPIIQDWHGWEIGASSSRVVELFDGHGKKGKRLVPLAISFKGGHVEAPFAILKDPSIEAVFEALVRDIPLISGRTHWVEGLLS